MKPLLLDLFCGAGGVAMGYNRAGFDVVGVDINPQPNYPFKFVQADALTFDPGGFGVIHASPPCQRFTAYGRRTGVDNDSYPNLISQVRDIMQRTGLPYVIENIEYARAELIDPILLCGSMFGLDVQRHRLFESNIGLKTSDCDHNRWLPRFPPATNRTNLRKTVEIGVWRIPLDIQRTAMGIDWMTLPELSQAIPPAYTEHIGAQLIGEFT